MEQKNFIKFILSCKLDKRWTCELIMALLIILLLSIIITGYFSLEKRALRGNTAAQVKLAEKCIKNNRLREAEFWLLRAGDNGDCNALLKLGDFFSQGPESVRDPVIAIKWYNQAANFPYKHSAKANALMQLSTAYELGAGVPQDSEKALKLLTQAAELDVPEAQWKLGCLYRDQKKMNEAFEWFGKAADANYSKALHELGCWYLNNGNVEDGLRMLNKAALENNLESLDLLGQLYHNGKKYGNKHVEKDEKKAVQYFLKAAKAGFPNAQYNLAIHYFSCEYKEKGCDKDDGSYKHALYWAKRAWAGGREDIKKYIDF